jgi:hypothetical protein
MTGKLLTTTVGGPRRSKCSAMVGVAATMADMARAASGSPMATARETGLRAHGGIHALVSIARGASSWTS